jgi:hypothetical protein
VESLIAHPATMTHSSMDPAARATAGIKDSLLRLSVGIELGADLVQDLTNALDRTAERARSQDGPTSSNAPYRDDALGTEEVPLAATGCGANAPALVEVSA